MDLFVEFALKYTSSELVALAAEKGTDVHTYVASEVLQIPISQVTETDRARSKNAFFAELYGTAPKKGI